jgi:hypothetical protein
MSFCNLSADGRTLESDQTGDVDDLAVPARVSSRSSFRYWLTRSASSGL